nr:MAG TPA: hypothetical protein [Caudoviricetes sp.]
MSIEHPNNSDSFFKNLTRGIRSPDSHIAMVDCPTPTISANSL